VIALGLRVLLTVMAMWSGLAAAPPVAAAPTTDAGVVAYNYDAPSIADVPGHSAPGRGPPLAAADVEGANAVELGSHGGSACPDAAAEPVAYRYDCLANPAQGATGPRITAVADSASAGHLSSLRPVFVAANNVSRLVPGGVLLPTRQLAATLSRATWE